MVAPNPITVGIKEYAPDQPEFGNSVATRVLNVSPRGKGSYGPFPDFAPYSTAPLPLRPQGAYGGADPFGNVSAFAGTATDLYQIAAGATTFANVSKSPGAYNCPADSMWSFALFNARVVAANLSDPIQSFVLGTSTHFADLASAAPKARFITTAKNFLIAANTNDPIGGNAPWRVWWSALGDPTNWPTPGTVAAATVQSDYNDTVGEGGMITGIVGNLGTADAAIFFQHAVWRMIYVGPPAVFNFVPAEGVRGTDAPGSIAQLGSVVFYLGEDGFYMFDGTQSVPIGAEKVDRTFLADLAPQGNRRITSAIDPIRKLYILSYPSINAPNLQPDTLLIYNWITQRWGKAMMSVDMLFRAFTFGYSLDGLDSLGYTLDTLPFSLDSSVWTAGALLLGAFQNNQLGYLTGPNLQAIVDTDELQPVAGQRSFVANTRPLIDPVVNGPGFGNAAIQVSILARDVLENLPVLVATGTLNSLGWAPLRCSGRYVRARITVPYGTPFDHIQGTELHLRPIGAR
jgi:hypothetical protein